jgi:hypothetical protein
VEEQLAARAVVKDEEELVLGLEGHGQADDKGMLDVPEDVALGPGVLHLREGGREGGGGGGEETINTVPLAIQGRKGEGGGKDEGTKKKRGKRKKGGREGGREGGPT